MALVVDPISLEAVAVTGPAPPAVAADIRAVAEPANVAPREEQDDVVLSPVVRRQAAETAAESITERLFPQLPLEEAAPESKKEETGRFPREFLPTPQAAALLDLSESVDRLLVTETARQVQLQTALRQRLEEEAIDLAAAAEDNELIRRTNDLRQAAFFTGEADDFLRGALIVSSDLTDEELDRIRQLTVLQNETSVNGQNELAFLGAYVSGSASFDAAVGRDKRRHGVEAEPPLGSSPESNIQRLLAIVQAIPQANGTPNDPSPEDLAINAQANQLEARARQDLLHHELEELSLLSAEPSSIVDVVV
jgi:hypothetical protein